MFTYKKTFSSFSVDDIQKAKEFYEDMLGIDVRLEGEMGMSLHLSDRNSVFIYPKDDHQPATFTVLNFLVADIDEEVQHLTDNGVKFEKYDLENLPQDEKGVLRGLKDDKGPDIAWFKDPAGNILSVLQEA